jgi:multiple sugar transport system permease protein
MEARFRKEAIYGVFFAMPAILGFLIFLLGPMIFSLILSFANYTGFSEPSFVGFANYKDLFVTDAFFKNSLRVTLNYVLLSIPMNITAAFLIAYMLSQDIWGKSAFRLIYYVPTVVPLVATSIVWKWLLDPTFGVMNYLRSLIGLRPSRFLLDEKTVLVSMAVMGIWNIGALMLIFLAGFQGIPKQLYEATEVDGGNGIHKFFYVTIPMMTSTIFFNLVIGCINGFQVFTQAYIITGGGPNERSNFLVLLLFREAFSNARMGKASAIAWTIFVIVMILTVINFKVSNKWVYYEDEGSVK